MRKITSWGASRHARTPRPQSAARLAGAHNERPQHRVRRRSRLGGTGAISRYQRLPKFRSVSCNGKASARGGGSNFKNVNALKNIDSKKTEKTAQVETPRGVSQGKQVDRWWPVPQLRRPVHFQAGEMACATRVIAYRSGSVPEVIESGVTGFIDDCEHDSLQADVRGALHGRPYGERIRSTSSQAGRGRGTRREDAFTHDASLDSLLRQLMTPMIRVVTPYALVYGTKEVSSSNGDASRGSPRCCRFEEVHNSSPVSVTPGEQRNGKQLLPIQPKQPFDNGKLQNFGRDKDYRSREEMACADQIAAEGLSWLQYDHRHRKHQRWIRTQRGYPASSPLQYFSFAEPSRNRTREVRRMPSTMK
jgi:hypothetical protein